MARTALIARCDAADCSPPSPHSPPSWPPPHSGRGHRIGRGRRSVLPAGRQRRLRRPPLRRAAAIHAPRARPGRRARRQQRPDRRDRRRGAGQLQPRPDRPRGRPGAGRRRPGQLRSPERGADRHPGDPRRRRRRVHDDRRLRRRAAFTDRSRRLPRGMDSPPRPGRGRPGRADRHRNLAALQQPPHRQGGLRLSDRGSPRGRSEGGRKRPFEAIPASPGLGDLALERAPADGPLSGHCGDRRPAAAKGARRPNPLLARDRTEVAAGGQPARPSSIAQPGLCPR